MCLAERKGQKTNPIDEGFMFSQSVKDLKIGLFPITTDQAILISALLIQIQFGDADTRNIKYLSLVKYSNLR